METKGQASVIKRFFRSNHLMVDTINRNLPDLVLHVGAPKCGSSAIQRYCMGHRQELLKKGYYYPEHHLDVNGVSGGHTQVAGPLIHGSQEQAKANFQNLLKEAKGLSACLLLSAEAFYGQYKAMMEIAAGLEVKVIGFLRHPVEYFLANHNQGIKRHMSTQRLNELIPKMLSRATGHLGRQPLLGWADSFSDASCVFNTYKSPDAGGELIEVHFLRALGFPEAEIQSLTKNLQGMTNRSYVKSALELKRLLNTVLEALPDHFANEVDWCLQGFSDQALNQRGYTMNDLSSEVRSELEQGLLSQMQAVIQRFPQLQDSALMRANITQEPYAASLDLQTPLETLSVKAPKVLDSIWQQAVVQRDKGRRDYAFCKLLDLLGIDFNEPKTSEQVSGLSVQQRRTLAGEKIQVPDCLREMAVLLERQGFMEDAQFVIGHALAKRPHGLGIQAIKARIDKTLELQEKIYKEGEKE